MREWVKVRTGPFQEEFLFNKNPDDSWCQIIQVKEPFCTNFVMTIDAFYTREFRYVFSVTLTCVSMTRKEEEEWKEEGRRKNEKYSSLSSSSWLFSLAVSSFLDSIHPFSNPSLRVIQWLLLCDTNKRMSLLKRPQNTQRATWHVGYSWTSRAASEVMEEQMPSHVHWSLFLQFQDSQFANQNVARRIQFYSMAVELSLTERERERERYREPFSLFRFFSISHFPLSISRLLCYSTQNEE